MGKGVMMDGTSTQKSYLVLGQREGKVRIGIRPLFAYSNYGIELMMRVRVAAVEDLEEPINVGVLATEMFPRARFSRSGEERVSIVVGIRQESLDPSMTTKAFAKELLQSTIYGQTLPTIYHLPGFEWQETQEEAVAFLAEALDKMYDGLDEDAGADSIGDDPNND